MHICRLRLEGFKSFANTVDIPFGEGLTALTGDNCCGKSTALEAIRWVMGFCDQTPQNAIFSSDHKKAQNARVTLTFAGCKGQLPGPLASQSDVMLSRTLTRSGHDCFHINGYDATLRDVKVLLNDARTDIPLLAGRKDLLELMETTPAQRSDVIQAAAGISGLLARYDTICDKLKQSQLQKKSLDTRIAELSKLFETAKQNKQSQQQLQQRQLKAHQLQTRILKTRWSEAENETRTARQNFQKLANACDAHENAQKNALDTLCDTAQQAMDANCQALNALDELNHIQLLQAHNEGKRSAAQRLMDQLEAEHTRLQETAAREDSLVTETRLMRDHAEAGLSALADSGYARISPDHQQHNFNEQWNNTCQEVRAAGIRLQSAQTDLANSADKLIQNAANNENARLMREKIAQINKRIKSITQQNHASGNDTDVHAARSDARQALNQAHSDCEHCRQLCIEADRQLNQERNHRRKLDENLIIQERMLASLNTRIETLEQLAELSNPETEPDDLSWLEPKRNGLEKALRAAIGNSPHITTNNPDQKQHWSGPGGAVGLYLPDQAEPLDTLVASPGHLAKRLAQCGLVGQKDGTRLQSQLHQGQKLVSLQGDMWRWDGLVVRAETQETKPQNSMQERLNSARQRADTARAELNQTRTEIKDHSGKLAQAEQTANECALALSKAMENTTWQREIALRAEAASSQARIAGEIRNAQLAELETEKNQARETLESLNKQTDNTSENTADNTTDFAQNLTAAHTQQAVARRKLDTLELQRKDAVRRLAELTEDRQNWNERACLAEKRLNAIGQTLNKITSKINATRSDLNSSNTAATELAKRATTAAENEKKRRSNAYKLREKLNHDTKTLASLTTEPPASLKEAEERLERALQHEDKLELEIRSKLHCDPTSLMDSTQPSDPNNPICIQTAQTELDALETAIAEQTRSDTTPEPNPDQNLQTLEKTITDTAREREKVDATAARLDASLMQLAKTATERTNRMFEFVDSHFRVLFPALVEGGQGQLELIPDRSPLNIGLKIHVRSNSFTPERPVEQISENEKILTAMALVLSIFTVRPALFGALDDIDASLDPARAQRLCMVLRHIADHTGSRFLLASSNELIASQCNTILTASMDEYGSNSVSPLQPRNNDKVVAA